MVGLDRAGRGRQVVAARAHRRRTADPIGQSPRPRRRHGRCPAIAPQSARASPICRRGSARISIPISASARTSSSSAACSGSRGASGEWRIAELLDSTGLAPFADRPAKKLSGGMRQKLGLCCALIHDPDLLILDEPTTGVDPLSRRQFWDLIERMRARRAGMSVIVATAYMEEAERFDWLVAMNAGRVAGDRLAGRTQAQRPARRRSRTPSSPCCRQQQRAGHQRAATSRRADRIDGEPVIAARDLTCRFGDFTAVDHVSFTIERGEIFGFVGSNGCGKTTTMKMLTGLAAGQRRARRCCSASRSTPRDLSARNASATCRSRSRSIPN